jgi:hypothetical protein
VEGAVSLYITFARPLNIIEQWDRQRQRAGLLVAPFGLFRGAVGGARRHSFLARRLRSGLELININNIAYNILY